MKLHSYGKIPEGYDYGYGDTEEFSEYDIEDIPSDIEEAWYWYASRSYEGAGQLLMLKEGRFYTHDCGHCSCYGPTDHITLGAGFGSLAELTASCTEEALKEIKPLIDMAKAQGYE